MIDRLDVFMLGIALGLLMILVDYYLIPGGFY